MQSKGRALGEDHGLLTSTVMSLSAASLLLIGLTAAIGVAAEQGPAYYFASLGLAGLIAIFVFAFLPERLPNDRFGPANFVTLLRGFFVCVLAGAIGMGPVSDAVAWSLFTIAAVSLLLDGLDGPLARRRGEATAFGARFDMEVDSLFILVLALLVFDLGKAGAWVLLAGGLRYIFVAAGLVWPWLMASLPDSRRRKAVFALQALALVAATAPLVPADTAGPLVGAGLLALSVSFAKDILWLHRSRAKGECGRELPVARRSARSAPRSMAHSTSNLRPSRRALTGPPQDEVDL